MMAAGGGVCSLLLRAAVECRCCLRAAAYLDLLLPPLSSLLPESTLTSAQATRPIKEVEERRHVATKRASSRFPADAARRFANELRWRRYTSPI